MRKVMSFVAVLAVAIVTHLGTISGWNTNQMLASGGAPVPVPADSPCEGAAKKNSTNCTNSICGKFTELDTTVANDKKLNREVTQDVCKRIFGIVCPGETKAVAMAGCKVPKAVE
jgi:hypothetical protein